MAILLCSYCISSIRSARREAQTQNSSGPPSQTQQAPPSRSGKEQSWVQRALEESRAGKGGTGRGRGNEDYEELIVGFLLSDIVQLLSIYLIPLHWVGYIIEGACDKIFF